MKVIKYYNDDESSRRAMKIFDRVLGSAYYNWPIDRLEVFLTDSSIEDTWIEGRLGKIFIGRENHYIKNRDEKGVESLMFTKIFSLLMKIQGLNTSELRQKMHSDSEMFDALLMIEDFAANRKVAKIFPDAIFYRSFDTIHRESSGNFIELLDICLSCLTFRGIDKWNSEFLEKAAYSKTGDNLIKNMVCKISKIIDAKKGDLDSEDLSKILFSVRNDN